MTAISSTWTYRGTALQGTAWDIKMFSLNEQIPERRGENIVVPSADGRVYRNKTLEQRKISMVLNVKGTSGSALEANIETLKSIFGVPGEGLLSRLTAGKGSAWTINAEVTNLVEFKELSSSVYNVLVEFVASSPFWEGSSYTKTEGTITSSPHNFTVINAGNAYNEAVTITASGGIVNPKWTAGDFWVQYTGTVVAGTDLEIDCENFVAWKGTVDVTGNITHDGGVHWMRIMPGSNTVSLSGSSLGTVTTTVSFTEYWL